MNIAEARDADSHAAAAFIGCDDFNTAAGVLDEVMNLAESNRFGLASEKAGEAMVPITTAAAAAWEVLHSHGLL